MCTLIVAHRVVADFPLLIVANRDEFLSRPSLAPAVRNFHPKVFCGLDAKEGGTWFGINAFGLVIGLTNLALRPPNPSLRSRGLLCLDMLAFQSVDEVWQAFEKVQPDQYNPFNLVAADGKKVLRVASDRLPHREELGAGIHVTTNWPSQGPGSLKQNMVRQRLESLLASGPEDPHDVLKKVATHWEGDGDPFISVCCHSLKHPGGEYGTRASTLVSLDASGLFRVQHADGSPCTTEYEDRSVQVRAMISDSDSIAASRND
jgi:uncharacterized protein with NRDE domain